MLVQIKRSFFGPGGRFYDINRDGSTIELPAGTALPKDAVVISEDGTLPSPSVQAIPGYGAKPEHEQKLDLIPGAAPTHQIAVGGFDAVPPLTAKEAADRQAANEAAALARDQEVEEKREADLEETREEVKAGLAAVAEVEKAQAATSAGSVSTEKSAKLTPSGEKAPTAPKTKLDI